MEKRVKCAPPAMPHPAPRRANEAVALDPNAGMAATARSVMERANHLRMLAGQLREALFGISSAVDDPHPAPGVNATLEHAESVMVAAEDELGFVIASINI